MACYTVLLVLWRALSGPCCLDNYRVEAASSVSEIWAQRPLGTADQPLFHAAALHGVSRRHKRLYACSLGPYNPEISLQPQKLGWV